MDPAASWSPILAFALGLSVVGLAFAAYEAVVLRPLPFNSNNVYLIRLFPQGESGDWQWPSGSHYAALRGRLTAGRVAALSRGGGRIGLHAGERALSTLKAEVGSSLFEVLELPLRCMGAKVAPPESSVVLSAQLARDLFVTAESGCGQVVYLDGVPHRVSGILPAQFRWQYDSGDFDLWVVTDESRLETARQLDLVVRLDDPATSQQLDAQLSALNTVTQQAPERVLTLRAVPFAGVLLGDNPTIVVTLLLIVLLAVSMGVSNIAALFLSRAKHRSTQTAIRLALGAEPGRIRGEILGEIFLYSAFGALLAGVVIAAVVPLVGDQVQAVMPTARALELNWRVMLFLIAGGTTAAFLVSLPSMVVVEPRDQTSLREQLNEGVQRDSRGVKRIRHAIIGFQFAVVTIIVTAAALSVVNVFRLAYTELGFDPSNVMIFTLRPKGENYRTIAGVSAYSRKVLSRVRNLPSVEGATMATGFPLGGVDSRVRIGQAAEEVANGQGTSAVLRAVDSQYFVVLRIPLVGGRAFSPQEELQNATLPVVVNQTLSNRVFRGMSPIGRTLSIGEPLGRGRTRVHLGEVIGVCVDSVTRDLSPPAPEIYVPPHAALVLSTNLVVRLSKNDPAVVHEITRQIIAADPAQFIAYGEPKHLAGAVGDVLQRPKLYAVITAVLAIGIGLLAVYGAYALMSYWLATRRRDLAIMSSLGASYRHLLVHLAGASGVAATSGLLAGALASGLLVPLAASKLEFAAEYSLVLQSLVVSCLAAAGILAMTIPVVRSWRIPPSQFLRDS